MTGKQGEWYEVSKRFRQLQKKLMIWDTAGGYAGTSSEIELYYWGVLGDVRRVETAFTSMSVSVPSLKKVLEMMGKLRLLAVNISGPMIELHTKEDVTLSAMISSTDAGKRWPHHRKRATTRNWIPKVKLSSWWERSRKRDGSWANIIVRLVYHLRVWSWDVFHLQHTFLYGAQVMDGECYSGLRTGDINVFLATTFCTTPRPRVRKLSTTRHDNRNQVGHIWSCMWGRL